DSLRVMHPAMLANSRDNGGDSTPDEDQGLIRCICDIDDDDGFTIQCENCLVWQHAVCVNIDQDNVPEEYLCEKCNPRKLDVKVGLQKAIAEKVVGVVFA
ncbi:SET domain-containing protein 3, partial [Coemansia sp. RSA 1797]